MVKLTLKSFRANTHNSGLPFLKEIGAVENWRESPWGNQGRLQRGGDGGAGCGR